MNQKKKIREMFRASVFARDNYKCRVCGNVGILDAHHITNRNNFLNGGYIKENGISLCEECHKKAEAVLNGAKIDSYEPDNLYKMIGSSYEIAKEKDEK